MKMLESPRSKHRLKIGIAFTVAILCAAAVIDERRFERACRIVKAASIELGGHPYSIGGWPIGREYCIRFDGPLTDDALRHLAAVAPKMRRIYLILAFKCEIPDARLANMRAMVASHRGIRIIVASATEMEKASERK